ncbi:Branched-chain amino acid ABC transporter, periplasmic amino acid-binding protein [Pseudomonas savastanoi pv. glycinea]|uniref:urea ABC transporter substrate-binding protein n=1 Tax=Pseudomonas quasicaspiana TaxID=2829821 RepID=UPI000F00E98A|nr:urea ABC transporter substrate-binding protein [Pseudomonas quasicaspiana]MCD5974306.1 urea ABC transporter substrate-binding protein [Pseudomonas quasicaspiana]MCD5990733.1 urea ABC transporter substrate-binding protein [Pseudomonas quasicaspiana]MCQ3033392.1 urea ABC transporter substrate-binding protein [Pseudomonas syringae]RMQ97252.1 Branched-chain amino acid ABC transporter, periplasmic amino acid-binding protein [Pseudomonas savastanoi pv. glycinea]
MDSRLTGAKRFLPRRLTLGAAALSLMAAGVFGQVALADDANTTGLAVTATEVTVGQLHSATGTMAISETGSIQAERLAIDQINASGGILGRQIKVVQEDGASDWPTFAEKAKKLLVGDKVAAVFGCWTSASRKAVLPVFEKENGLLYYPTFYEGLEQSKNVIYTGQEATQQILASLDWIAKTKGAKTFYLIGSDYIWPRTSMKIARKHIENVLKGTVVGEDYYPLGNTQFGSLINKVKLKKPDVVFAAVVGGSNVAFYKQMKAAGVTAEKQNLLTLSVTEDELLGIGGENMKGFYASMKYFQSLDNPNNKAFVDAFKAKYGKDSVMGDVTQAAYLGPWLWKAAVEKAGSFDIDKVVAASPGIELKTAPEGYVKVHENHHLWSKTRIGEVQSDGQFKVIYESDLIEPNPFPKGYQ